MKKKYKSPEMEVIELSGADIIVTSGGDELDVNNPFGLTGENDG